MLRRQPWVPGQVQKNIYGAGAPVHSCRRDLANVPFHLGCSANRVLGRRTSESPVDNPRRELGMNQQVFATDQ